MKIVATYADTGDREEQGIAWTEGSIYEVLQCPACSGVTLRTYYWHDGQMQPGDEVTYHVLYPSERATPRGLPEELAKDYEAAQRVKNISPNAYGVLLGRVLELVCVDRQAHGNSLHQKLQDCWRSPETDHLCSLKVD